MKHWHPEMSDAVPLDAYPQRRRKRDWTSVADYPPPRARPSHHGEMRTAARVGLTLIALACAAIAIGAGAVLAGPDPIDALAIEP